MMTRHLVQPVRVGENRGRGQLPVQREAGRLESAGQAVGRGGGGVGQVTAAPRQVQRGGIRGGQRLQVADHPRQPQDLIAQRAELGGGGFGHAVKQRLVACLQHRDGGTQLVGDIGDEVAADLFLPFQGAGHLVEGGRQLTQLSGRADLARPGGVIPGRHGPGHRDQPGNRAGDPPGHRESGEQREQGRQTGSAGDGPQ